MHLSAPILRAALVGLLVLLVWTGADYALHFGVLAPIYDASPNLWRPTSEMNVGLIFAVRGALIAAFMATYHWCVKPKSVRRGILFGLMIGLQLGIGVGLGTYIHFPVPPELAMGWICGAMIKSIAAGWIVGALLRPAGQPQR